MANDPASIAATLRALAPAYAPTPLLNLTQLSRRLGVAQVLAKDEGRRMLGSFKSLGGTYAGLAALARLRGTDIAGLLTDRPPRTERRALGRVARSRRRWDLRRSRDMFRSR